MNDSKRPQDGHQVEERIGNRGKAAVWAVYFTEGWDDGVIWESALVEMMATTCLCYTSGLIDTTIGKFGTSRAAAYAAVSSIFLLTLFILAIAPGSGGHVNPLITFSTMNTGLTGFSRGILYMLAQTIGAALAGATLRGSERAIQWQVAGAFANPELLLLGRHC
ncbi:hypothetical protein JMJ35_006205 [Cladonia borealis]|uniref:Aquaporin n=1 Tax=Cladonia borealis TaxID=184061 RepID=A0AA39V141_9LECA|nr:hypothetical protein JMJ35_006205 [Cladonia borealis]